MLPKKGFGCSSDLVSSEISYKAQLFMLYNLLVIFILKILGYFGSVNVDAS